MRLLRRGAKPEPSPPTPTAATPQPEVFVGTTITPDEGAAARIDSAADVDPNIKKYGASAVPGGAGGFGGAGTK